MAQFAECDATHVVQGHLMDAPPGSFQYFGMSPDKPPVGLHYSCPCGCGSVGTLRFRHSDNRPSWEWDGNTDKPTLKPSIRSLGATPEDGDHWHGYLTAGRFVSV